MSCPFAHDDAAYVLGALSPAQRLAFERHLRSCEGCTRSVRELAGLPGLLGQVDAAVLEQPSTDEPVPGALLASLSRAVTRARRRRTALAVGLAAAVAVAAGTVPVVLMQLGDDEPSRAATPPASATAAPSAPVPMAPVGDVPVRADVVLEQVLWGTRLDLVCTYDPESVEYDLPPAADYALFVSTRDGRSERVGSWRSLGGKTMRLSAATATSRGDISSVEVRTRDGRVVLRLAA